MHPFPCLRLSNTVLVTEKALLLDSFFEWNSLDPIDTNIVFPLFLGLVHRRSIGYDLCYRLLLARRVRKSEFGYGLGLGENLTNSDLTLPRDINPNAVTGFKLMQRI